MGIDNLPLRFLLSADHYFRFYFLDIIIAASPYLVSYSTFTAKYYGTEYAGLSRMKY